MVGFFPENELPTLSIERNTKSQIELAFKSQKSPKEPVYLD